MDHDHINNESCFDKFRIPWARAGLGRELTEEEIEALKNRLLKLSNNDNNIISSNFFPSEICWIEENVENAVLQRVTNDTKDRSTWCVIGPDEETVKDYVSRI